MSAGERAQYQQVLDHYFFIADFFFNSLNVFFKSGQYTLRRFPFYFIC